MEKYEIADGVLTVRCDNARTIQFVHKHAEVGELIPGWIDVMVESLMSCMKSGESANESSALLEYMKSMEKRLAKQHNLEGNESRDLMVMEIRNGLSGMQQSMMSLLSTIENVVKSSLGRLDTDLFGKAVSDRIENWMQGQLTELKNGQVNSDSLAMLSKQIGDEMWRAQQPITTKHEHIMSLLSSLPTQLTNFVNSQDTDARTTVGDQVKQMRSHIDTYMMMQATSMDDFRNIVTKQLGHVDQMWANVSERDTLRQPNNVTVLKTEV